MVDHHILAIHHVYDTGDATTTLLLDLLFLASGLLFMGVGWLLMMRVAARAPAPDATPRA